MAGSGWTKEAVSVLLDEYQKYPCLYEVKTPIYHNRNARREAEISIAESVSQIRPNTSQADVKAKINGLRTQFTNERNKVMKCLHSGMGGSEVYKPTFTWYDRMLFLIPHVTTRSSKSNLDQSATCSSDDSQVTLPDDSLMFDDNGILTVYEEENAENQSSAAQLAASTSGTARKRKKGSIEDSVLLQASKMLQSASNSEDADDEFGKFIASQLKGISDPKIKMLTKHKIQTAIMDAELELLGLLNTE